MRLRPRSWRGKQRRRLLSASACGGQGNARRQIPQVPRLPFAIMEDHSAPLGDPTEVELLRSRIQGGSQRDRYRLRRAQEEDVYCLINLNHLDLRKRTA